MEIPRHFSMASLSQAQSIDQNDISHRGALNGNLSLDLPHKTVRKITCLGSGFVGGPTSAVTAFMSNIEVTVVDVNPDRIAAWQSDSLPIYEPGLYEIVKAARDGDILASNLPFNAKGGGKNTNSTTKEDVYIRQSNLFFSTDIDKAIESADLIFVCVNTPTKRNGVGKGTAVDLGFVEAATRNIARVATNSKIVVEKSTVPCRTAQSIREILSANAQPGVRFDVLSNPEFLAEGTAIRDLLYPDRIIIGSMPTLAGSSAAASLAEIYAQWVPKDRIITMNLWSSELSKLAANAMLAQRISSVNALSAICEVTGADVDEVSHACGLDSRIGPHMLKAGPGFGGSCFQKDIFNIVYLSESLHLNEVADYWRSVIKMNEYQKQRFSKRIISCLFNNLAGKKIAVLGFAFKKGTSDTRESPAITLVGNCVAESASVSIYDPKVSKQQIWKELIDDGGSPEILKQSVEVCASAYIACADADAVVVVTEWDEFSNKTKNVFPASLKSPQAMTEVIPKAMPWYKFQMQHGNVEALSSTSTLSSSNSSNKENQPPTHGFLQTQTIPSSSAQPFTDPPRLDWARIAQGMRKPSFVFDGRNILDARKLEALGFHVEAIGHASAVARHCHD